MSERLILNIISGALIIIIASCAYPARTCQADPVREFPCVSCEAYDYGWLEAAGGEYKDQSDCEFEVEDDWDKEYLQGCEDYVRQRAKK